VVSVGALSSFCALTLWLLKTWLACYWLQKVHTLGLQTAAEAGVM